MKISFIVNTVPVGQPRPRACNRAGYASVYEQKNTPVQDFKSDLRKAAREAYSGPVLTGPVSLVVMCFMPRPKSLIWKKRPMPSVPHTKKPDLDNIEKAILDALNKILWQDDSQVFRCQKEKRYHDGSGSPSVFVVVEEVND